MSGPTQRAATQENRQVVVHHRFHVLEPIEGWSFFVVVEPASKQHQTSHHQRTNGSAVELKLVGEARSPPELEQPGGNLNAVETAADIAV